MAGVRDKESVRSQYELVELTNLAFHAGETFVGTQERLLVVFDVEADAIETGRAAWTAFRHWEALMLRGDSFVHLARLLPTGSPTAAWSNRARSSGPTSFVEVRVIEPEPFDDEVRFNPRLLQTLVLRAAGQP